MALSYNSDLEYWEILKKALRQAAHLGEMTAAAIMVVQGEALSGCQSHSSCFKNVVCGEKTLSGSPAQATSCWMVLHCPVDNFVPIPIPNIPVPKQHPTHNANSVKEGLAYLYLTLVYLYLTITRILNLTPNLLIHLYYIQAYI